MALFVGGHGREVRPDHELCAEPDGLVERGLGQVVTGDAVGKPGIVFDACTGTGLAAGRVVLDDDGVETLGRRIDGSGEAGRSGADDNDVVELFVGASVETDAVGQLCARKVQARFVVVTIGPLGNRAVRTHEDGKAKAVGNPRAERTHEWVTIEIDPTEQHPITTEEVAQVLHVRRVPTTDEICVARCGVRKYSHHVHSRLRGGQCSTLGSPLG